MGTWTNDDGLYIKYGPTEATVVKGGEYMVTGPLHMLEFTVTLADLGSSSAPTILSDTVTVPSTARLERAEVMCQTAVTSAGSGAKLNVGLIDQDRTTAIDIDGIVDSLAQTAFDVAGENALVPVGGTGAGADLGTTPGNAGLVCAYYETEAFTAGVVVIRIFYYIPTV